MRQEWFRFIALSLIFLPMSLLSWIGCTRDGQVTTPPVLAMVNGEAVSMDEFSIALTAIQPGADIQTASGELKTEILNQLIEKKLLLQETRLRGIQASDEELGVAMDQLKTGYSEEGFDELLKTSGLTLEDWKRDITENILIDKLMNTVIADKIQVTDEEIQSYYKNNRKAFRKEVEVRARQIVVETEQQAKLLHQQLTEGAIFAELAEENSVSPDRSAGGDLGYFIKGQMPEAFEIVFTMKVGAISPVVKSPFGYHIFKLEDKRPARVQSLGEVREVITQQLANEKEDQLRTDWIQDLKAKAYIKINSGLFLKQDAFKPS